MSEISQVIEKIRAQHPLAVQSAATFRDQTILDLRPVDLVPVARVLRDDPDLSFRHLEDIASVDRSLYPGHAGDARFAALYTLVSPKDGTRVRLRVAASGGDSPVLPSVTGVWAGANWFEREAFDLMGIKFEGHPDLRRILMPLDWPNHPLRKDLPRGGEPVPFSMTWEDEEFSSFGTQILEAKAVPQVPPKHMDSNRHMILNMGPQHPATHGVLRVIVELSGERVVAAYPDIGYLHSGFEKQAESIRYKDFTPYTDRSDYVSSMSNNLAYALAVEKLMGVEIPPRAQAIRVIMAELQRIASHLLWLGTYAMDVSGMGHAVLMYCFREREQILDILELVSGARMTTSYIRPGGVWRDVPESFADRVRDVVETFPSRIDEYERMLTHNSIWRARLEGIGPLTTEQCQQLGVTGPLLRASGMAMDYRKLRPYSGYEQYQFDVPTATAGDCYARYQVRVEEMRQSLRIVAQALRALPDGPVWTSDRKMALPPRQELDTSMEALIHHFKLMTEGMTPPLGEVYECVEGPRGEHGYYLMSDGGPKPYRLHMRTPSFVHLQATDAMSRGQLLSDLVMVIGSIDIVLGDVDR
jgi:NADH dehydrogenase I D subunit